MVMRRKENKELVCNPDSDYCGRHFFRDALQVFQPLRSLSFFLCPYRARQRRAALPRSAGSNANRALQVREISYNQLINGAGTIT